MDVRRLAVISLSNRDFPTFEAKLHEAVKWLEHAAGNGAQLAVLPETINVYRGDGLGNPVALKIPDIALDDWQTSCAMLIECASRCKMALTIPVFVRAGGHIYNSFFLISAGGKCIGEFRKRFPPPGELDEGVCVGGKTPLMDWNGIKVGGAICFDSMFSETFSEQAEEGARLFLMPSLWPGGSQLNHYCRTLHVTCALSYPAWSRIIDIDGEEKAAGGYRSETLRFGFGSPVYCADINFDRECFLSSGNQSKIVEIEKFYGARIKVEFNQQDCEFYVESLDHELSISDIKKEFDLIPHAKYMKSYCDRIHDFKQN
jgi:predicted amidohydrolase